MKLISWNIDSLNAALTSDSARAQLSRAVIDTLVAEKVRLKSICKSWKTISLTMTILGVHLLNLPVKVMLEPCSCIKKN